MKSIFISIIFTLITIAGVSQNKAYISTEKAIVDINYMIKTIEKVHYNPYFSIEKEQFDQNKNELLNKFGKDSILFKKFVTTGMKLAAQMSGGHTAMDWQNKNLFPELMLYKFIPFTGKLSNDNQYLIVTRSTTKDIKKGTFIKSINGIRVVDLYRECMSYIGGIESFKNVTCEKVFPLYLFFTNMISAPYYIEFSDTKKEFETAGLDVSKLNTFISQDQQKENYIFEIVEDEVGLISYNSCTDY